MKRLFLAVLFALSLGGETWAFSSQRTDQLLWDCLGQTPAGMGELGRLSCGKYLDGIMDMHSIAVGRKMPPVYCIPPSGISMDQAMRIFIDWANKHPKELHTTARTSVVIALRDAFPCSR